MSDAPTLFGEKRLQMTDSIRLTVESLAAYGAAHEHWALAWSGGKDSTALVTLVVWLIETGRVPAPKTLTVLYADTRLELLPLALSAETIRDELHLHAAALAARGCAEALYTGRTFRAASALLRARGCDRLVILSALHGAVADDRVLAPYERCLSDLPADDRRHWALVTRADLSSLLCELAGARDLRGVGILAIVPEGYAPALRDLPTVTRLFAGLPQGRLFSAVSRALDEARGPAAPTTASDEGLRHG